MEYCSFWIVDRITEPCVICIEVVVARCFCFSLMSGPRSRLQNIPLPTQPKHKFACAQIETSPNAVAAEMTEGVTHLLNHSRRVEGGDSHPRFCTLSRGHSFHSDGAMVSKGQCALLISCKNFFSIVCNKPSFQNPVVCLQRTESLLCGMHVRWVAGDIVRGSGVSWLALLNSVSLVCSWHKAN